jgi:hypothetical protein
MDDESIEFILDLDLTTAAAVGFAFCRCDFQQQFK